MEIWHYDNKYKSADDCRALLFIYMLNSAGAQRKLCKLPMSISSEKCIKKYYKEHVLIA